MRDGPSEIVGPVSWPRRDFQVWAYSVAHSQLLLRSVRTEAIETRIDVLFKGVSEFKMTTNVCGIEVLAGHGAASSSRRWRVRKPAPDDQSRFSIRADGRRGLYVIALAAFWVEDSEEFHEPSELWPHEV
jgi:hypothetical protein